VAVSNRPPPGEAFPGRRGAEQQLPGQLHTLAMVRLGGGGVGLSAGHRRSVKRLR
jgi:hypothetical protein